MPDKDRREIYAAVWQSVECLYRTGYCVSERGLQAALYSFLSLRLREAHIVVEPSWTIGENRTVPDLVVVEGDKIRDIFELKFVPHHYADAKEDVKKLLRYGAQPQDQLPVRLNPDTGQWDGYLSLHEGCERHFVAIANYDAAAVWGNSLRDEIPELLKEPRKLNHWYGRVGGQGDENTKWGIDYGI